MQIWGVMVNLQLKPGFLREPFINRQGGTRDRGSVYMCMLSQWVRTFPVSPGFCLFSLKKGFLFHILLSHKNLPTFKCEGRHALASIACAEGADIVALRIFKTLMNMPLHIYNGEAHCYIFSILQERPH